jgi:hypothetical protein
MNLLPVRKRNANEIKRDNFNKAFPLLIKGLAKNWPALEKWSFDYFAETYPNVKIPMHDDRINAGKPLPFSLREPLPIKTVIQIIKDIAAGNISSEKRHLYAASWTYQTACPKLNDDINSPDYIADNFIPLMPKMFHFAHRSLFLSHQLNISRLHYDPLCMAIFFTVVKGKKTVRLISPLFKDKLEENVDLFDESILNPLLAKDIPIYEATVETGDTLFIPPSWFHAVRSDTPAIALSESYVGKEEFLFFEDELVRQMAGALKFFSTQKRKILQDTSFEKIREHYDYLLQCTDFINSQEIYTDFLEKDSQDRRQLLDSIKG